MTVGPASDERHGSRSRFDYRDDWVGVREARRDEEGAAGELRRWGSSSESRRYADTTFASLTRPSRNATAMPPRGSGAAARVVRARGFHSTARPRLRAGLRPAPPAAASSAGPGSPPGVQARPGQGDSPPQLRARIIAHDLGLAAVQTSSAGLLADRTTAPAAVDSRKRRAGRGDEHDVHRTFTSVVALASRSPGIVVSPPSRATAAAARPTP